MIKMFVFYIPCKFCIREEGSITDGQQLYLYNYICTTCLTPTPSSLYPPSQPLSWPSSTRVSLWSMCSSVGLKVIIVSLI